MEFADWIVFGLYGWLFITGACVIALACVIYYYRHDNWKFDTKRIYSSGKKRTDDRIGINPSTRPLKEGEKDYRHLVDLTDPHEIKRIEEEEEEKEEEK